MLKMNPKQTDDYFIMADAALESTETLSVVSADPNTVVLTPDAVVRPAPAGLETDPALSVTIGSGKVSAGPTPVLKTPITCTATITDSAGGAVPAPTSDTCEIDPAIATKIGVLFGPTPA